MLTNYYYFYVIVLMEGFLLVLQFCYYRAQIRWLNGMYLLAIHHQACREIRIQHFSNEDCKLKVLLDF